MSPYRVLEVVVRSCALLVSTVLDGLHDGTFPDFSLPALVTCRLCHPRVGADGFKWELRFLLRCRVRVSPGVMAPRAGRTQSLDRIQGITLWRGAPHDPRVLALSRWSTMLVPSTRNSWRGRTCRP